ncbi:hypothetical protein Tco_0207762 [Tanacetum coccineum]
MARDANNQMYLIAWAVVDVEQRKWQVFASGYKVAEGYLAVAAYMKQKIDPDLGVSNSYSQSKWFDTYKFSIKPVYGYKMWKPTRNTPPLPPIVKTMPGRPRKSKIKHPSEQEHEHAISRASRVMTCILNGKIS